MDSPLKIVAQIVMPIQHCLVRGNRRTKVRRLYSHPQALAQCRPARPEQLMVLSLSAPLSQQEWEAEP